MMSSARPFAVALGGRAIAGVSAMVIVSIAFAALLLLSIARAEDENTARHATAFVEVLVDMRAQTLKRALWDHSDWGESYRNLHLRFDRGWAFDRNNLGRTLFQDFGVNYLAVVDPERREIYALVDGEPADGPMLATLSGGVESLLDAARAGDATEAPTASGILVSPEGEPILVSARRLTSGNDDSVTVDGRHSVLLFGDRLSRGDLGDLSAGLFDDALVISLEEFGVLEGDDRHIDLRSFDGTHDSVLHILVPRPGRAMLLAIAPWATAMVLLFLFAALLIARQGRRIAALADEASTATAEAHRLARHQALHDPVTGLPNRLAFEQRMEHEIARERSALALLYLDLDHFKPINDTHGHAAGDFVLGVVARRIDAVLPSEGFAARIGGDEFVALLRNEDDLAVQRLCRNLIASISAPIPYEAVVLGVGVSVGISRIFGEDSPDDAVRRADAALYEAKAAGRQRFHWFSRSNPATSVG